MIIKFSIKIFLIKHKYIKKRDIMKNYIVNPILTNYLVPRNERFKEPFINNQINYSNSKRDKKSDKTTNTSEIPFVNSYLDSPKSYSINQSLQNNTSEFEDQIRTNDFYKITKNQKSDKIQNTFEDSADLIDSNHLSENEKNVANEETHLNPKKMIIKQRMTVPKYNLNQFTDFRNTHQINKKNYKEMDFLKNQNRLNTENNFLNSNR